MKKGISLVALVVTIIVLIILTGAVILSFQDGGIIDRADQAVEDSNDAVLEEKITMMNLEYTQKLKKKFTPETRATLKAIVEQSGIDLDKLLVYYDKDGEQIVLYKIDKVNKSDVEWFIDNNPIKVEIDGEEKEKNIYYLIGDTNLDGELTEEDVEAIRLAVIDIQQGEISEEDENYWFVIGNTNGDIRFNSGDAGDLSRVLSGNNSKKYSELLVENIDRKIEYLKTYFGIE